MNEYTSKKRRVTPGRNTGKNKSNLNAEVARIQPDDLLQNPGLNLEQVRNSMISNQVEDANSALMNQISNLNINKKVKK